MSLAIGLTAVSPATRFIAAGVVTSCVVTFFASRSDWWSSNQTVRKMASAAAARKPTTYTVKPSGTHSGTVIFLHGLGDTGQGWSQMFQEIREPHLKYLFPTAASIPVTLNGGMRMPSWFDLYGLQIGGREDQEGIKRAAKEIVSELIAQEESAGIKSDRIVVGGFSQGGALALYSALTLDKQLAGAMSLSSWLPIASDFPKALSVNKNIPILVCHGDSDTVVTPQVGLRSRTRMAEFAPNITSKIYRGVGHSSSEEEMIDVRDFIRKCLPNL